MTSSPQSRRERKEEKGRASSKPLDLITTEVSLPVFPLEHRCQLCQIYSRDPELFNQMSQRLLTAQSREEIVAWLKGQGIRTSLRALYRHYSRHVEPYIRDTLEFERRLRMEVHVLEEIQGVNIAGVFARKLAADGLTALRHLDLAGQLSRIRDPELVIGVLREFARLCKALADIDRAAAEVALKEQLVELRRIELISKAGRLEEIAGRVIEDALRGHPELARQVRNALASSKAKPLTALPTNAETNRSSKSSRGR